MVEATRKAQVLIEALPYILRFRHRYTVVKYGGSVMRNERLSRAVFEDVVFMSTVGMKVVMVHGGGQRISEALAESDIKTQFINGLRCTDEKSIRIIERVMLEANREMALIIEEAGGLVTPVLPASGALRAEKMDAGGEDLGLVGDVAWVDIEQIEKICRAGAIPLIPPLAYDRNRVLYNINADHVASRLAMVLKAQKLVFLTDQPGIMRNSDDPESLISTLRPEQARSLIEGGVISSGMIPKVTAGLAAMEGGVENVHLVGGHMPHALLLEIFTSQGVGTEILPE